MKKFLEWFEKVGSTSVLKAGLAHLWFVTIHPFEDGNIRIGRAIADMVLARDRKAQPATRFYSMSAQIREERRAYYLKSWNRRKQEISMLRAGSNGF